MKVSIITVTYNSAATLGQCIQSVLEQTYPDIEYLIIDGASTDKTLTVIDEFRSRIDTVLSEKDEGLYDAINKGIALATGDVVAILHSDDFYTHPKVIDSYVKVFEETQCDAVYSDLYYVDSSQTNRILRKWKSGVYKPGDFLEGWMPPHPTFFVKRTCYQKFGAYNLQFKTAADYELMLRFIHKNGIHLSYLPEFTVKMRVGGQSNSSLANRIKANLEDRKAWKVNGLKPKWYTLFLKPLKKIFQFL